MSKFIKPNPYFYKHIGPDESIINKLFVAYESMDINLINEQLIQTNINLVNKNNENGLHIILNIDESRYTEEQKFLIVKELIEKGIDVNKYDINHKTPLHIAVMKQYPTIIELLLDRGASVDYKDDNGMTPLHLAMIRLVKKCPEKKKVNSLIKEPEQKDLVNNTIYKLITKNFLDKISQNNEIKKYFDFIVNNINSVDSIDVSNSFQNIITKNINEIKDKISDKSLYEGKIKLEVNELIQKTIDNITKETQKFYQKLIEDKLNLGVIPYVKGTNTQLPENNDISIDGTIVNKDTIFSGLIGNELLSHDIGLNLSELDKKMDQINITSYNIMNKENSLYGKCLSMIEGNGSVYNLTNNLNDLTLLFNTTISWLDFLQYHEDNYILFNNVNPVPIIATEIQNKNTIDYTIIQDKLGNIVIDMHTSKSNTKYLIDITIDELSLAQNISGDFQFNNKIFGKYKDKLEHTIERYFETYVSNNLNIFTSKVPNKTIENIKLFYETISGSIIDYQLPIDNNNNYNIQQLPNNVFAKSQNQLYVTINTQPIYNPNNPLEIPYSNPPLTKETILSHIIHKLLIKIKENTDFFGKLTKLPRQSSIIDVYEEVIEKLLMQYNLVGRLCYIINQEKRVIENQINITRKVVVDNFKDNDIFIFKEEIEEKLLQLNKNIEDLGMDKDKLIDLLILQRDNVNSYILELNKLNARRLLQHNIKQLNKIEYPSNIFVKPIPSINIQDIKSIVSSTAPADDKGTINNDFYNCVIPFNKEYKLYLFSNANTDPIINKDIYIIMNPANNLVNRLNTNPNNNYVKLPRDNTPYDNNDKSLLRPFYFIKDVYLNYVKHELLLELYSKLDTNDINIKGMIDKLAEPLSDLLLFPATYIKIVSGLLMEEFKVQVYITAQNMIVKKIPQINDVITSMEPASISLAEIYTDPKNFELDIAGNRVNFFFKNITADDDYVNRKYTADMEKAERLYQSGKFNDNLCVYTDKMVLDKLEKKVIGRYDTRDNNGNTPIYYAINGLLTNIINQKLLKQCQILNIANNSNKRPIEVAINNLTNYFNTIYNQNKLDCLKNITNKYTEKYHRELTSLPDFNNNILNTTKESLNKFMILLMFNFYKLLFPDKVDNFIFNIFSINKLPVNDNNKNRLFGDYIMEILNIDYIKYNEEFSAYINKINEKNEEGLYLFKLLTEIHNIINDLNNVFNDTKINKRFVKSKYRDISVRISEILPVFKYFENIIKIYENIKLVGLNNLENNDVSKNIFYLYESILLSDLTCNLKDSLLTTFSQYTEQRVSGQPFQLNIKDIDSKLKDKLILKKYEDLTDTVEKAETFTGKILLNKLNLKISKLNDPNKIYKDTSDITNSLSTYINSQIFQNIPNQKYQFSHLVEKNILGFYKKNYTLLIDGIQNVFHDFVTFYITLGKHLTIMNELIHSLVD
jgi:hypothetical protein